MNQKNILLAESGATKTDWVLLNHHKVIQKFETQGLNPSNLDDAEIQWVVSKEVQQALKDTQIDEIIFYGAGCANEPNQSRIKQSLKLCFEDVDVSVYSDLKAAGLATLKESSGLVGILGTGSSVAVYNGKDIDRIITKGAFPDGDKGSGSHIGSELLAYVLNEPSLQNIQETVDLEDLFNATQMPKSGKIVAASFVKSTAQYRDEDWYKAIVSRCFDLFFEDIKVIQDEFTEIAFVGSIAFLFKDEVRVSAAKAGFKIGTIVQSPIQELINKHIHTLTND